MEEKLPGVPSIVIDGLLSRFTESSRGSATSAVFNLDQSHLSDDISPQVTSDRQYSDIDSDSYVCPLPACRRFCYRLCTYSGGFEHATYKVSI